MSSPAPDESALATAHRLLDEAGIPRRVDDVGLTIAGRVRLLVNERDRQRAELEEALDRLQKVAILASDETGPVAARRWGSIADEL